MRGYQPGRFSFNVKGGRCEACSGDGTIKIEMHFLPDVYVPCEICKGARYNRDTLEVLFRGKSIADVLDMSCEEALRVLRAPSRRSRATSGPSSTSASATSASASPRPTLSGGEAQRVKLASELSKRATGHTLYVLDEPTTGLHFDDVKKLLGVLHRLVDQGNTVLVIEHNLDVVKTRRLDHRPRPRGRGRRRPRRRRGYTREAGDDPRELHGPLPEGPARALTAGRSPDRLCSRAERAFRRAVLVPPSAGAPAVLARLEPGDGDARTECGDRISQASEGRSRLRAVRLSSCGHGSSGGFPHLVGGPTRADTTRSVKR